MATEQPIGEKIKEFRKSKSLTIKAFAKIYGLEVANLYKWEKGTKPSDQEDYKKLEQILNGEQVDLTSPGISKQIGTIEERIISLEAWISVLKETQANQIAQDTGKQA